MAELSSSMSDASGAEISSNFSDESVSGAEESTNESDGTDASDGDVPIGSFTRGGGIEFAKHQAHRQANGFIDADGGWVRHAKVSEWCEGRSAPPDVAA